MSAELVEAGWGRVSAVLQERDFGKEICTNNVTGRAGGINVHEVFALDLRGEMEGPCSSWLCGRWEQVHGALMKAAVLKKSRSYSVLLGMQKSMTWR